METLSGSSSHPGRGCVLLLLQRRDALPVQEPLHRQQGQHLQRPDRCVFLPKHDPNPSSSTSLVSLLSLYLQPGITLCLQRLLASESAAQRCKVPFMQLTTQPSCWPRCIGQITCTATMRCGRCAGYNPKTKPKEQGGGSTGRAGCGKPTNYKNSFSGSGTVSYGKAWCALLTSSVQNSRYACANKRLQQDVPFLYDVLTVQAATGHCSMHDASVE